MLARVQHTAYINYAINGHLVCARLCHHAFQLR
jgi:hypothetical protein